MKTYLDSLKHVLQHGRSRTDRTGTGTLSVFGSQRVYPIDLKAFPIVTTKYVNFDNIVKELLWFISGDTNSKTLEDQGCNIWRPWGFVNEAYGEPEDGALGPVYGAQWRNWNGKGIDQLKLLMEGLKTNPFSRRHILTAWNPEVLPDETLNHRENIIAGKQVLPPCHTLVQFYVEELTLEERLALYNQQTYQPAALTHGIVSEDAKASLDAMWIPKYRLSSQLYQRSLDKPLGEPYNITSYALLTALMAHCLGYATGVFIHTVGDEHIYKNQVDGITTQLEREPYELPQLMLNPSVRTLEAFTFNDIKLFNYKHHPMIKYEVAV